jgi:hypothetical protein
MTMHEAKKLGVLVLLGLAVLFLFWSSMLGTPTGLSSPCPNCRQVAEQSEPNHAYILPAILLLIAIVSAHTLSHLSAKITIKKCLTFATIAAVLLLAVVFGLSFASPTGASTMAVQRLSSIIAALGVIGIFLIGAYEIISHNEDKEHEWNEDKE